jgi:hypothetical protein
MNLLCNFAHRFPQLAADILERDRHKRRNFREETITDVLMAGLVPFEPLNIMTDYPANESLTGEDMDWEFVDEHALDGRKYLRLHIQAKRAHLSTGKKNPYWLYRELDHAVGPITKGLAKPLHGSQHKLLVDEAKKIDGCVPLYMFYHPGSALDPASTGLPRVEGVNWMFADIIPENVTTGRWSSEDKKLTKWRPHFHPLSDLLCFGNDADSVIGSGKRLDFVTFLLRTLLSNPTPGEIVERLNERRGYDFEPSDRVPLRAASEIPAATLAAVRAARDGPRLTDIERPRVIFISRPK